jgi:CBS domain-containing protein/transcriptional regulator with XRE-family HTH domain
MSSLARTIGVSRATLYSWLRGDTVPDLDTMSRLADALGLMPSELLALVGEREPADAMALEVRALPALRESSRTMNAWDPEWTPPSQGQVRMVSPKYPSRRKPPGRDVRLLDVLVGSEVMTAEADERIGPVVERMYQRAYSQVPVYRGENLVGVLTAETIARWLGSAQRGSREALEHATVSGALGLAESERPFLLAPPSTTVREVLLLFEKAIKEGQPLTAVILTGDGSAIGRPLGIVTAADLPRLGRHARSGYLSFR